MESFTIGQLEKRLKVLAHNRDQIERHLVELKLDSKARPATILRWSKMAS